MTDSAHLDRVAKAMWDTHAFPEWDEISSDDRDLYRALAQAAIDALGQPQQQWTCAIALDTGALDANAHVFHSLLEARKHLYMMNSLFPDDRRVVVTRWGPSAWFRVDGGDA